MKEISLQTNQFLNLTTQGVANTKILLQNQGPDVMYIFKQSTAPTMANPAMALFNWQSVEVDNLGGDIWVASQQAGTIFVTPTSDLGVASTVEFPPDLYTSTKEGIRRLRVDTGETGFYDGRIFELSRKITSPIVFRFTCSVPFILHNQHLTCSDGDIEMFAWSSADVTASGTWTNVPIWRENEYNDAYVGQTAIASGGVITVNNAQNYRDYARVKTSNATAQQSTVQGSPTSARYHKAGTYYIQCTGVGTGSYYINWEERP